MKCYYCKKSNELGNYFDDKWACIDCLRVAILGDHIARLEAKAKLK
jgi:hypothetical protein